MNKVGMNVEMTHGQKERLKHASKVYKKSQVQILRDFIDRLPSPPKKRIPEFKTQEEETKFWETHSFADYQDEIKPVETSPVKEVSTPEEFRQAVQPDTPQESEPKIITGYPSPMPLEFKGEVKLSEDNPQPTSTLQEIVEEREHAEVPATPPPSDFWEKEEPKKTEFDKEIADVASNGWGEKLFKRIFGK